MPNSDFIIVFEDSVACVSAKDATAAILKFQSSWGGKPATNVVLVLKKNYPPISQLDQTEHLPEVVWYRGRT